MSLDNLPNEHAGLTGTDPLTDARLDPSTADELDAGPGIPWALHAAVGRARKILRDSSMPQLQTLAVKAQRMAEQGALARIRRHSADAEPDTDYWITDDVDDLHAYLDAHGEHHTPEDWPLFFAALAMRNAGYVIQTLESEIPGEPARLEALATEALRAVSAAEGAGALGREFARRRQNANSGRNTRKDSRKLADAYVAWVMDKPKGRYKSHAEAVRAFEATLIESKNPLAKQIFEYTPKYLREKLHEHCDENGTPYPFLNRGKANYQSD